MKKLDKNLRKKMAGLLPFNVDSIDKFTPIEFSNVPEEYRPIFHIKPWTQSQKDSALIISEKLQDIKNDSEKVKINKELNDLSRQNIKTIEKLYDIGTEEFIDVKTENGCITLDVWNKIPMKIQTSIYFRLSSISGIFPSEVVGL